MDVRIPPLVGALHQLLESARVACLLDALEDQGVTLLSGIRGDYELYYKRLILLGIVANA